MTEREECARHIEALACQIRDHGPKTPEGLLTAIAGAQVGVLLDAAASLRTLPAPSHSDAATAKECQLQGPALQGPAEMFARALARKHVLETIWRENRGYSDEAFVQRAVEDTWRAFLPDTDS